MIRRIPPPYVVSELPWRSGSRRRRIASVPYFAKARRIARYASSDSRLISIERLGVALATFVGGQEVAADQPATR